MNKKTLIFGKGFMGSRLQEELECPASNKRISSFLHIEEEIKKYRPKIIINCLGSTGEENVDSCEKEIDKTLWSNSFIPILFAEAALRHKIKLVHISSGCIYHFNYYKDRPLTEKRAPDFFNLFYSRSKIYSEGALERMAEENNILIARLRIPLDNRSHHKNILDKLIKYQTVIDIPNSVTYVPDFIGALRHLIKINAGGIYNIVNKGGLRYPYLLDLYKKYKPDFSYSVIDLKQLGAVRTNILLSVKKLEQSGYQIRNIKEAAKECVSAYCRF